MFTEILLYVFFVNCNSRLGDKLAFKTARKLEVLKVAINTHKKHNSVKRERCLPTYSAAPFLDRKLHNLLF